MPAEANVVLFTLGVVPTLLFTIVDVLLTDEMDALLLLLIGLVVTGVDCNWFETATFVVMMGPTAEALLLLAEEQEALVLMATAEAVFK